MYFTFKCFKFCYICTGYSKYVSHEQNFKSFEVELGWQKEEVFGQKYRLNLVEEKIRGKDKEIPFLIDWLKEIEKDKKATISTLEFIWIDI